MRGGHREHVVGLADRGLLARLDFLPYQLAMPRFARAVQAVSGVVGLAEDVIGALLAKRCSGSSRGSASGISSRLSGRLRPARRPCSTTTALLHDGRLARRFRTDRSIAVTHARRPPATRGEQRGYRAATPSRRRFTSATPQSHCFTSIRWALMLIRIPMPRKSVTSAVPP